MNELTVSVPASSISKRLLARVTILGNLSDEDLGEVATECVEQVVAAGSKIIDLGDDGHDVYFLLDGTARVVSHTLLGASVRLSNLEAGCYFGELSAIDGRPPSAEIEAVTECRLARVSPDAFRRLLAGHPSMLVAVLRNLAGMIRDTNATVLDHATL